MSILGEFVNCVKCGKPLIKRLPNGLWHFSFGRFSKGSSSTPVEMLIHGDVQMQCRACGHVNTLNYFPWDEGKIATSFWQERANAAEFWKQSVGIVSGNKPEARPLPAPVIPRSEGGACFVCGKPGKWDPILESYRCDGHGLSPV